MTRLNVWMNGELVGYWSQSQLGKDEFRYAQSWLNSEESRPISQSMPLRGENSPYKGDVVSCYFENLLPDSEIIRRRIKDRFKTKSTKAMALLTEIGRDCVGAIQITSDELLTSSVKTIEATPLKESQVAKILRTTVVDNAFGVGAGDEFRISIAGAQEKTALLFNKNKWCVPHGSTPTTHIFKLPLGNVTNYEIDLSTSVENEWLCLKILRAYGLSVANAKILSFEDQKVLSVERFDRKLSADKEWLVRLPVEDMCQAHGIHPSKKYESDGVAGNTGPGIEMIMRFLLGSSESQSDRETFIKTQILFYLLCATDGHAKNFSTFIMQGGAYKLTPLYDVISAHPILGKNAGQLPPQKAKLAMGLIGKNKHYHWATIKTEHILATAKKCGIDAVPILNQIVADTPFVLEKLNELTPKEFPAEIFDKIMLGLEASLKRLM